MTQREKNLTKEAYDEVQNEKREKQKDEIKKIITKSLEELDKKEKNRKDLDDEIRILRRDVEDFKEGRLDRVEERQQKDPKAKNVSVVTIVKKEEHHHYHSTPNWWYRPYEITWNPFYAETTYTTGLAMTTTGTTLSNNMDSFALTTDCSVSGESVFLTCSSAKDFTQGTYLLPDGSTKYV